MQSVAIWTWTLKYSRGRIGSAGSSQVQRIHFAQAVAVDFLTAFHQKAKAACAAQNPFRASFTKDSDVPLREQLVIAAQKRLPADSAAAHPAGHNQAGGQNEGNVNTLLHIATISGMLASLMRHFRASLSSLPLLAQPVENLPIGTWSSSSQLQPLEGTFSDVRLSVCG